MWLRLIVDALVSMKNRRPAAKEIVLRLVLLKHLTGYAEMNPPRDILKQWMEEWSEQERQEFEHSADLRRISYWRQVREDELWKCLTPEEQAFANTTTVTMTERQRIDFCWRVEAAQMLMWAAGMVSEIPPYDIEASSELLREIPLQGCRDLAKQDGFRSREDVDRARDIAELWHWRSRTRELIERGKIFKPDDKMKAQGLYSLDDIARRAARMAAEAGEIPPCIDGDFPAMGKAYRDLTDHEWCRVRSITMERHFALNWLCGYAPCNRWDETPTDT